MARRGIWKYNIGQVKPTLAQMREIHTSVRSTRPATTRVGQTPAGDPKAMANYVQNSKDCAFLGMPISQWHTDLWLWDKFFQAYTVKTFIELGTGKGGFSTFFLLNAIQYGFSFDTFDTEEPEVLDMPVPKLLGLKEHFHKGSIWTDQRMELVNLLKRAKHPIMLFCDNGDKVREVQSYSIYLESGDYVAVHDWNKAFKPKNVPPILEQFYTKAADDMHSYSRWMRRK